MQIKDAHSAYWFLYSHPASVDVDPEHPIVAPIYNKENNPLGITVTSKGGHNQLVLPKYENEKEYRLALKERRDIYAWDGQFIDNLDIYYTKVNPQTHRVEDDKSLNTEVECWLETGRAYWNEYENAYAGNSHDTDLDVGAPTFDEALIKLAEKVKAKYGDYVEDALS